MDPEIFVTFHQEFLEYRDSLAKKKQTDEYAHMLASVNLLTSTIASDYRLTLTTLDRLTAHGEITWDLLYAILIPRSILVARCSITGLPRLLKLTSWSRTTVDGKPMYRLVCESVDLVDRPMSHSVGIGRIATVVHLRPFRGTVKIDSLDAYPIKFHQDEAKLRKTIAERGKKWVGLIGVHHKQFDGIAALKCGDNLLRHNVGFYFLGAVSAFLIFFFFWLGSKQDYG